ncbi:MAG TPA: DUF349 domain-containing protein [Propionibacteriaceae bacterium]|nr:DUF349 domain-containing protein [Propionibacteriaceae bacterium]
MSETAGPDDFGRVEADGTVYVRTADGERSVGQVPDVEPAEALAFFVRRFLTLETEVGLLEARVAAAALSPEEARRSIDTHRTQIVSANAVGDLQGLVSRLDALLPTIEAQLDARRAEKAKVSEESRAAKEAMVIEAEKLALSNDWRGGVNRFRALLDEWKALPRIDRATDDAMWHRFSTARTTYTRRRKAQFADQAVKRDSAKATKEAIIEQARTLAKSTDWGPTAGAFRDLMTQWKSAGAAPRDVDDALWATFRELQDEFFTARNAALHEADVELDGNLAAKIALLDQAEASILPVTDLQSARTKFRAFLTAFNEHGHVPRDSMRTLDARVRTLETAVKQAEEAEWRRTDPEARQRAQDTVNMFSTQIEKLEAQAAKLEAAGDARKAKEARASIETYTSWLDQARMTLNEFSA